MGLLSIFRIFYPTWEDRLKEKQPNWDLLIERSQKWKHCATSEIDAKKDWITDAPLDHQLRALGIVFAQIMYQRNAELALHVLKQIHERGRMIKYEELVARQKKLG